MALHVLQYPAFSCTFIFLCVIEYVSQWIILINGIVVRQRLPHIVITSIEYVCMLWWLTFNGYKLTIVYTLLIVYILLRLFIVNNYCCDVGL